MERMIFEFWKDNEIDKYFPLTAEELKVKFREWLLYKSKLDTEKAMLQYYAPDMVIRLFLGDPEEYGLASLHNEDQMEAITKELRPILKERLKALNPKMVSVIYIEGHLVEIHQQGTAPITRAQWVQIMRNIAEDLDKGKGFYPLEDFTVPVEWKIVTNL